MTATAVAFLCGSAAGMVLLLCVLHVATNVELHRRWHGYRMCRVCHQPNDHAHGETCSRCTGPWQAKKADG